MHSGGPRGHGRPAAACRLLALAVVLGAALAPSLVVEVTAAAAPSCFGAAARDPGRPCSTPSRSLFPPRNTAGFAPADGCREVRDDPAPVCRFGVSARRATRQVALVGDSHALHWRAALDVVARRERWHGLSVTTPACFFSAAVRYLPDGLREPCEPWYRSAQRFFRRHPEISTVFVSQKADTPLIAPGGTTASAVRRAGFRRAWAALPRSVKRVVVIRDVPDPADDMFACLERAVAAGQDPGTACATPRSVALRRDFAVSAAALPRSRRLRHVDLTSFFCDADQCFPAVGGVRVYNDVLGHLTVAYARTLAPYLHRALRRAVR
jgi:hypothetical protein